MRLAPLLDATEQRNGNVNHHIIIIIRITPLTQIVCWYELIIYSRLSILLMRHCVII